MRATRPSRLALASLSAASLIGAGLALQAVLAGPAAAGTSCTQSSSGSAEQITCAARVSFDATEATASSKQAWNVDIASTNVPLPSSVTGKTSGVYLSFNLNDNSLQLTGNVSGGSTPTESVDVNFSSLTLHYTTYPPASAS